MGHISNKYRLPAAVVWAVTHDRYDPGEGDVSCTTLIAPAQIFQLRKTLITDGDGDTLTDRDLNYLTYNDIIEEDASERIWSMIGSAVHYILENACIAMQDAGEWHGDMIAERRFYHTVGGKKVSAQIDLLDENNDLNDFKVTSVWSIKDALENSKEEWTAQLNIQSYLMHHNGVEVRNLFITAIARDWNKSGRMRDPNYPPRAVKVPIRKWTLEQTEAYIQGRINALYSPYQIPCTPKETWESQTKHALMKTGRKSALRLLDSEDESKLWAHANGHADIVDKVPVLKTGFYIETRWGERKRCDNYCDMMPFCDQYKDWIKSQVKEQE
jgi:hypothetical protein